MENANFISYFYFYEEIRKTTGLFLVATKMNAILIFTKKGGERLAIINDNMITSCYEDEYYFMFTKTETNNWL